jgi:hypothetical protein
VRGRDRAGNEARRSKEIGHRFSIDLMTVNARWRLAASQ